MAGKKSPASKEQERFLPVANVSRIMKKSLPANAKISKEAKETVQECVSEFISFITAEASDKCHREKRKTINGDDLLWAMTTLGFHNYVGPLKLYLNKYTDTEGDTNSMPEQDRNQDQDSLIGRHDQSGFFSIGCAKPFGDFVGIGHNFVGIGMGGSDGGGALAAQLHQW